MLLKKSNSFQTLQKHCGKITRSKGFDVSRIVEQCLLFASEVAEALEVVKPIPGTIQTEEDSKALGFMVAFVKLMEEFEKFRKNAKQAPNFQVEVVDKDNFEEELADLQIRLLSFVDVNFPNFEKKVVEKMKVNAERAYKHNKQF